MYANCSETARIGALLWKERFRTAVEPVFNDLYESVASGKETKIVIEKGQSPDYRQKLGKELEEMGNSEIWRVGATVRSLRSQRQTK
jgi:ketol-acid reductoisomerase